MRTNVSETGWVTVHDVRLEIVERGEGRPILWLHGEEGLDPSAAFLDRLAVHGQVLAPSHPGFGHSPDADGVETVDDLSYLYPKGSASAGIFRVFKNPAPLDEYMERGLVFARNPDSVYRQIKKMYDHVGGFGHLLIMGHAGFLDHDETVKGMQMFAREVYPCLKELERAG